MFRLADSPHIFPGKTLIGSTTGPVVDTDCELPIGGRVYLSKIETWEAAKLFGFVEPDTHAKILAELKAAVVRVAELEGALDANVAGQVEFVEAIAARAADAAITRTLAAASVVSTSGRPSE